MRIALTTDQAKLAADIQAAASQRADLILAPRGLTSWQDVAAQAELSDGPFAAEIANLAKQNSIAILASFVERCTSGTFKAALMSDHAGHMICCYRQTHLPEDANAAHLDHGQWLTQAMLNGVMTGLLLGEDLLHPELARALAVSGTSLLLVLEDGRLLADTLRSLAIARALENHLPVVIASASLTGMADPNGRFHDGNLIETAAPISAGNHRRGTRLARRRPQLYHAITMVEDAENKPPL